MVNFVIVTHGEFGAYMMEAAESIVGRQTEGVRVVSVSSRQGVAEIRERIQRAIGEVGCRGGLILFTDMPGGTPCNLSFPLIKETPGAHMISGVNLYMLVTAFNYRGSDGVQELVERILRNGGRSICDVGAMLQAVR